MWRETKLKKILQRTGRQRLAVEKLNEYFLPQKNALLETDKFRQLKQITEETID
jgi:hypothetical protein